AAATVGVLVPEGAVDDVGDGLEAAVRVPGRPLGLARRVVHLAHLVHVDERVERPEVDSGERTADWETLALERRRCRGDGENRPVLRHGPIGVRNPGQYQDVVDSYRRHDLILSPVLLVAAVNV